MWFREENRAVKQRGEGVASYYLRFRAEDRPGVLSKVSGILGDHGISISDVSQKGRKEHDYVPIVMLTHEAAEGHLLRAKAEIDRLPFIDGEGVHIRIEAGGQ
jgi:homoserine dehydrogenase